MRFSADVVIAAAKGAEGSAFGQDYVLLDPPGRMLRGLNETGARVWQLCDGHRSVGEIAQVIAREFGAAPERALTDVQQFLEALAQRGLLAPGDGLHSGAKRGEVR